MEMNFCRRCGAPLQEKAPYEYLCSNGHTVYLNPSPTVGIFLINQENEIMLGVRGIEPHKGMLDTFGGFITIGETVEEGLVRELREELSLEPDEYEIPKYIGSAFGKYGVDNDGQTVLGSFFWARLLTDRELTPSDDVAGIYMAHIDDIDLAKLHNDDIRSAVAQLKALNLF